MAKASVDAITGLWMEVARMMQRHMSCIFKNKKINPLHLFAVQIIQEHANLTMKEFADYLRITSPSATSLANRLVDMELITRHADPANRKLVRLRVNSLGSKTLESHMKEFRIGLSQALSLLNEEDQRDFARILSNLRDALQHHSS